MRPNYLAFLIVIATTAGVMACSESHPLEENYDAYFDFQNETQILECVCRDQLGSKANCPNETPLFEDDRRDEIQECTQTLFDQIAALHDGSDPAEGSPDSQLEYYECIFIGSFRDDLDVAQYCLQTDDDAPPLYTNIDALPGSTNAYLSCQTEAYDRGADCTKDTYENIIDDRHSCALAFEDDFYLERCATRVRDDLRDCDQNYQAALDGGDAPVLASWLPYLQNYCAGYMPTSSSDIIAPEITGSSRPVDESEEHHEDEPIQQCSAEPHDGEAEYGAAYPHRLNRFVPYFQALQLVESKIYSSWDCPCGWHELGFSSEANCLQEHSIDPESPRWNALESCAHCVTYYAHTEPPQSIPGYFDCTIEYAMNVFMPCVASIEETSQCSEAYGNQLQSCVDSFNQGVHDCNNESWFVENKTQYAAPIIESIKTHCDAISSP